MSNQSLYDKLIQYGQNGNYAFHMPGHKRQEKLLNGLDPFDVDITEINDFDNLHHAEGIIREAMENAASFWRTDKTWFLVNGSSSGLLAAITAVTDIGDSILVGRNCHKAVYNTSLLRNLNVKYIFPEYVDKYHLNGGYDPKKIDELLTKNEKIKAVIITSPTYDGIVSDIKKIAETVHRHNAILIVDEAHGAHLGISAKLPEAAYHLGADIVIESVHKTLPSLTQTALLHLCGNRVESEKIEKFLSVYQSSSPSYLFLAGIDRCIRELQKDGENRIEKLLITIDKFREKVNKLKFFTVPGKELQGTNSIFDIDITKLILCVDQKVMSGKELADILRTKYHFEMEMETVSYVLGITSICDDMKEIERLGDSLVEIDNRLVDRYNLFEKNVDDMTDNELENREIKLNLQENEVCYSIYEAENMSHESVMLEKAEGRISTEYIYLYPPEIPLIVPGEVISKTFIEQIKLFKKMKLNINGLRDRENRYIHVIVKNKAKEV